MNSNDETQTPPPPPPPIPFAVSAAASALGRQGRGISKQFSAEEIQRRRESMARINETKAKTAVAKGTVQRVAVSKGILRTGKPTA